MPRLFSLLFPVPQSELANSKADTALSSIGTLNRKDRELQAKEKTLQSDLREKTESLNNSLTSIEGVDIGPRVESKK